MAKIRTNLADAQQFEAVPKDWYSAHISKVDYGDSKASIARGAPEKMFTLEWTIDEGEYAGRKIPFDTLSLSPKAAGLREDFLDAIRFPRTCLSCGNDFTESRKIPREESKINKAGLGCPNCGEQGETEWDAGEPVGKALETCRCKIGVIQEKSNKAGDDRMYNRVEAYAPIH